MRVHDNNFGFLRLGFALLVIVGHSFELNIGKLAVDGFFIISGYLYQQLTGAYPGFDSLGDIDAAVTWSLIGPNGSHFSSFCAISEIADPRPAHG